MTSKFFTLLVPVALAFICATPSVLATPYTPTQFKAELTKKIGTKKGNAAAVATAAFFQTALTDAKNKKNVAAYTLAVNAALKKSVSKALLGSATNQVVKALTIGYFRGITFNLNNSSYTAALKKILNALPAAQRTATVSGQIYRTIRTAAASRGVSSTVVYNYYLKVKPSSYPKPVS